MLRLLSKVREKDQISTLKYQFVIFISLLVSFILLTSPVNLTSTIYTYDSKLNKTDLSINLLEPNPENITFELKNIDFKENKYIEIKTSAEALDIHTLRVKINDKNLNVEITNTDFIKKIKLSDNDNESIILKYSSKEAQLLVINNNLKIDEFIIPKTILPIVTGIHVNSNYENPDVKVDILTKPHTREIGTTKIIIGILILFMVFILINKGKFEKNIWRIRLNKYDLLVILFLVLAGLLTPPGIDDGEILSIQRNFSNMGFASTYSNAYPLGQWWFLLNSNWANYTDQIFLLRLPNLVCYLITWFILDRLIIIKLSKVEKLSLIRNLNTTIFIIFIVAWAGTLRYDPIALPLLAIIFASALDFKTSKNFNYALVLVTAWALSITSGLSGWIASLTLLIIVLQNLKFLRQNLIKSLATFFFTISFLLYLLLFNSNPWLLRNDIKSFTSSGETHKLFMFDEISRYESILRYWGSAANWSLFVFFIVMVTAIFSIRIFKQKAGSGEFQFLILVLFSAGGLVLTTSKYGWHFQSNLPIIIILSTYILQYVSVKYLLFPLIIITPVGVWLSLKAANVFNYTEATTIRVNGPVDYFARKLPEIYGINNSLTTISLSTLVFLFIIYYFRQSKNLFLFIFTANILVAAPTMAYPLLDGVNASGWQFTKQNVYGIANQDWRCGISGTNEVTQIDRKLDVGYVENLEYVQGSYYNSDFSYYKVKNYEKEFSQLISTVSNYAKIDIWFSGVTTPQDGRVVLKVLNEGKEVRKTSLELNDNISKNDWQLVSLNLNRNDQIFLEIELTKPENFRISTPSLITFTSLNEANLIKGEISTYRANLINFPCEVGDDKNNGVKKFPVYQFGLATNMGRDAIFNNELDLLPVGCLEMKNSEASGQNCFYETLIKGDNDWQQRNIKTKSKGWRLLNQ
jgi:hypothetical protein